MRGKSHRPCYASSLAPEFLAPRQHIPSTLDVSIEPATRSFLRKIAASGGRLFLENDADRRHAQACVRHDLAGPSPRDRRCFNISPKGLAYLARLRSAE